MEIINNLKSQNLSKEEAEQRSIDWVQSFIRKYSKVKVGLTDNHKKRTTKYESDEPGEWDVMYLLYSNANRDIAHDREVMLIQHFGDELENKGEYEGPDSEADNHYVYAVYKK